MKKIIKDINKNRHNQSNFKAGLVISASCLLTALSTPLYAENLLEVYGMAYETDPILKEVISQTQSVKEGKVQAFAAFLPQIYASADSTAIHNNSPAGKNSSVTYNAHGYIVDLEQSLFDNRNYVNYRISKINISSSDANLSATQQDLIIRTADAYFRTLAAIDTVGFSKAERKAISRQLDQAQRRYEVGIIAITDVHEAQAGYDNANATVIAAENQLLIAKETLRELTSQYIDDVVPLAEKIPLAPPSPEDIQHWVDQALDGNYTLLAAREDTSSSRENIELQRSGHYPTLGLTASYGYLKSNGPNSNFAPQHHEGTIGVNVSLPIYEGYAITSRTQQAQYDFQNSQDFYDQVWKSTEKNTRSSYLNVISEVSRVKALAQAVVSNESALRATEAGFEVGTRTIVDVLNVQSELYRAKQEHSDSRYIYVLNTLRLKQASGELSRVDLETVNGWLKL